MSTNVGRGVYSLLDISKFCKYDWIWMLDVDFIDLTSYTYLVTGHREVAQTQRRGFPSDQY